MIRSTTLCLIAVSAIVLTVTHTTVASDPMTRSEAIKIIDSRGADPVSGIWRFGNEGATVAILPAPASSTHFEIYLLDSPDMSVIPGDMIGSAVSTGETGIFDAEMFSRQLLREKRQRFIMTLGRDGHLGFKSYKKGRQISLLRFIPYLFRVSIKSYDTRPESVDGAVKIYPDNHPSSPTLL